MPLLTVITISVIFGSCTPRSERYRFASGSTWGTFYNITYRSDRDLHDSIRAVMAQVDSSLSMFNPRSVVSAVNARRTSEVDHLFADVFTQSVRVNRLSHGAFDPTVAPLVNIWGFGSKGDVTAPPTAARIDSLLRGVGIHRCTLDTAASGVIRVSMPSATTAFDFSAIAKGYGCDLVARMLRRNGCSDYLVEIGGEVALSGTNDRGEKWRLQIDAPVENRAGEHRRAAMVQLTGCGVASSGNYRNYRSDSSGTRYGHTISPVTGRPYRTELLAVTVIAPTTMEADALATAAMSMTVDEAREMIDSLPSAEALFITAPSQAASGHFTLRHTKGFPRLN